MTLESGDPVVIPADLVAEALGVRPLGGPPPAAFDGVNTDSRALRAGQLFVALKGERFDAHDFLAEAVRRGAAGIVCRRDFDAKALGGTAAVYPVEDTLEAFRRLAGAWRARFRGPVVAVAGSVGKTTTKELLAACLRGRWAKVLHTRGSLNGFVGIPITLLRLRPDEEAAVIEIGIDAPGAMVQHVALVRPTAAVVTAIAEEHLEHLGDLETVAREEALALRLTVRGGGLAALNLDDAWLAPLAADPELRSAVTFSLKDPAAAYHGRYDGRGTLTVTGRGLSAAAFAVPLPGAHNAGNLLAAIAIAAGLGLGEAEIRRGLATFTPPAGRAELLTLQRGIRVIGDHYNAVGPASVRAGLSMLAEVARGGKGKAWACLGDMLELGPEELVLHRGLADAAAASGATLLLFGERMRALASACAERRLPARHFATIEPLIDTLLAEVRPGDTILVKGSRGMKMERVFDALREKLTPTG